jgi:hypothetical protein
MTRLLAALLALAALMAPIPAAADSPGRSITAGEFRSRAEPLLKKSMAALMFSGEARKLVRILGGTATAYRARLDAERAAGRPVTVCPPPKGKAVVDTGELMAYLRSLPPAQQSISFDAAFANHMARKHSCRR